MGIFTFSRALLFLSPLFHILDFMLEKVQVILRIKKFVTKHEASPLIVLGVGYSARMRKTLRKYRSN
jgi:hypothetical protein